jgi:hypothetical protein
MSTKVAKTANKRDIANSYSQLSEICHEASNEIQAILKCYEESGEQFKECIPVKNIQDQ